MVSQVAYLRERFGITFRRTKSTLLQGKFLASPDLA